MNGTNRPTPPTLAQSGLGVLHVRTALALSIGILVASCSGAPGAKTAEAVVDLARVIQQDGLPGLERVFAELHIQGPLPFASEPLAAQLLFDDPGPGRASFAILVVQDFSYAESIFFAKSREGWRAVGRQEARWGRRPRILATRGGRMVCTIPCVGGGTGLQDEGEWWFLVSESGAHPLQRIWESGYDMEEADEASYASKILGLQIQGRSVRERRRVTWDLRSGELEGAEAESCAITLGVDVELVVDLVAGELKLECADLQDDWNRLADFQKGDAHFACAKAPDQVLRYALRAGSRGRDRFIRDCIKQCDDPLLAANLEEILRGGPSVK